MLIHFMTIYIFSNVSSSLQNQHINTVSMPWVTDLASTLQVSFSSPIPKFLTIAHMDFNKEKCRLLQVEHHLVQSINNYIIWGTAQDEFSERQFTLQECINDNTHSSGTKYSAHWNAKRYLHSFISVRLLLKNGWYVNNGTCNMIPHTMKNKFTVLLNKDRMLLYTFPPPRRPYKTFSSTPLIHSK